MRSIFYQVQQTGLLWIVTGNGVPCGSAHEAEEAVLLAVDAARENSGVDSLAEVWLCRGKNAARVF